MIFISFIVQLVNGLEMHIKYGKILYKFELDYLFYMSIENMIIGNTMCSTENQVRGSGETAK